MLKLCAFYTYFAMRAHKKILNVDFCPTIVRNFGRKVETYQGSREVSPSVPVWASFVAGWVEYSARQGKVHLS